MKYNISYDKLLQYAFRILSKKRYTHFEMKMKLTRYAKKRKKIDLKDVDAVLERLVELDYLDDKKFVKDYVSNRVKFKPRGKLLLCRELKIKGIHKDLISSVFNNIEIDEFKIAFESLNRRINRWRKHPLQKQKMKAYQFLYSKGFERDPIYKAIARCYNRID
jgi:regulatory protein